MIITDLEAFTVAVPFRAPLISAFGISYPARVRTFIRLHTDEGFTGIGETGPSAVHPFDREGLRKRFIHQVLPTVRGESPFDHARLRQKLYYSSDSVAIELACWDIIGKAAGVPLYRLLGGHGAVERVPVAGYCFFRAPGPDGNDAVTVDNYVQHCLEMQRLHGFSVLKLKLGAHSPQLEAELVRAVRAAVPDHTELRIDPNGSWSVASALRSIKRLEDVDLEYIEEPIRVMATGDSAVDVHGLRRLRRASRTPIAADHCYRMDLLAQIVKGDAADLVLADVFGCGGIADTARYCRTAAGLNLGVAIHSGTELGVGQAAKLHLAAALRQEVRYAGDAIYPEYVDDVLVNGKLGIVDGHMDVPQAPGLGVELDEERLERWRLTDQRHKELDEFWRETKDLIGAGYPTADLLVNHY